MKLVVVALASLLALPVAAHADQVLHPPGGPVYTEIDHRPQPQPRATKHALRRALMEHFDRNGDGRLGRQERKRAIRVLGRLQRKLAGKAERAGKQGRPAKLRRFIERFDTNRDGTVDRGEMPPRAARKLRRFDRDRDGWLEPGEAR